MKKDDKVKCVDRLDSDYLTEGKIYEVVAGAGAVGLIGWRIDEDSDAFEVVNDNGNPIYCCGLTNSSHATWELVE